MMRTGVLLPISAFMLATTGLCHAENWFPSFDRVDWTPWVYTTLEFNDNRRLQINDFESVWGGIVDAATPVTFASAQSNLRITPRVRINRFADSTENVDSEDGFISADLSHSISNRLLLNIRVNADETNLIFNEFDDTGILASLGDKRNLDAGSTVSWQWSEKGLISGSLLVQDVSYVDAPELIFTDYTYYLGSVQSSYQINERIEIFGTIGANFFNTPDTNGNSLTYTANAGARYRYSDSLTVSASAGVLHSKLKFEEVLPVFVPGIGLVGINATDEATDTGHTLDISAEKSFERASVTASFNRGLTPSGRGVQTIQKNYSVEGRYEYSARTLVFAEFERRERNSQNDLVGALDTTFERYRVGARWRLNGLWSIEGRYTRREITRALGDTTSISNAAELVIRFAGYSDELHTF